MGYAAQLSNISLPQKGWIFTLPLPKYADSSALNNVPWL